MLQMCGAFAEFERSMLRARIAAGLRRTVADDAKLSRPLNDPDAIDKARLALSTSARWLTQRPHIDWRWPPAAGNFRHLEPRWN
jgi:DNA invertase Pin-like site-specific DNA recombinase